LEFGLYTYMTHSALLILGFKFGLSFVFGQNYIITFGPVSVSAKFIKISSGRSLLSARHGSVNRKTEPISDIWKNRHWHRRQYFKNRKKTKTDQKNEKTDTVGYFPISYLPQVTTLLPVFTARCTVVQSAVLRSHVVYLCLSVRPSVCLSVCLSVTLVDHRST